MMAKKSKKPNPRTEPEEFEDNPELDVDDRSEELGERPDLEEPLLDLYRDVEKGFENQYDRSNSQMDYWDIYHCRLGAKQYYSGNSQIFLPIVHDAIKARKTRFTNQIFPQAGRYIDVTTENGDLPHGEMSLLEHYIRRAKLRTTVVPALCVNGDVEGQYNVYVSWKTRKRHVTWRKVMPLQPGPPNDPDADEEDEDIEQEVLNEGFPHVEVIADADICILPATAETIDDALEAGGSVTVLRRWSKYKIKKMMQEGEIIKEAGQALYDEMIAEKSAVQVNKAKNMTDAAGVKMQGDLKHALVYETWTMLTIGNERRICRIYYGGEKSVLSCKRNPHWSDKVPIFSCPVDKVQGSFKGKSQVQPVEQTQYYANDAVNEAADSSMYALMPIVLTDPAKNPRVGSMVLSLAAVWETSPHDTQFANFPALWKEGFEIVAACKAQIMQTLSVSPAAITQSTAQKSKPSQADVAREQQVDILTTADAVSVLEEGILTPVVNFMLELDHQHRKNKLMIRMFGEAGLRARMDWVPPIQMDRKYAFKWFGVEQARTQMQMQQQIAGLGTIMKIPAEMYKGHRLNLVPYITHMCEALLGPRLAPLVFIDEAKEQTLDARLEDEFIAEGHDIAIHPMDNDAEHLKQHQQSAQQNGDPLGHFARHIQRHMIQMQLKQTMAMQQRIAQMMGPQAGQQPGGGKPGAQVKGARGNGQQHPGAAHKDLIGPLSGQMPGGRNRGGFG